MSWKIEFGAGAAKELKKIGKQDARRIINFLRKRVLAAEHPRAVGEPLRGPKLGRFWKYRVGHFRIIAEIEDSVLVIFVVRVGHRSKVYKKR